MDELERKIRQVMYRMTEKRSKEYPQEVFKESLLDVIRTQVYHGRIDPGRVPDMERYAEILISEFYCEDIYEDEEDEFEEEDYLDEE